jgi:predicted transcriptional regulator
MNLSEVVAALGCQVLAGNSSLTQNVENVCACDLMSDVLVVEKDNLLLVTSLTTEQVVRTADIVGAHGILISNGKKPLEKTVQLARQLNLPLLSTKLNTFEVCVELGKLLKK